MYVPATFVRTVFRHEAGHVFGGLSDEYTHPNPHYPYNPTSCSDSREEVGEGATRKLVCPVWRAWPDYAACIPGCTRADRYKSTEKSVMRELDPSFNNEKFSIVQCAHLTEQLDKLLDPTNLFNFEEGMAHCIENRDAYDLTWEAARLF